MTDRMSKLVDRAVRLLRAIPTDEGPVEVGYSGGKDSDVILELARMSGIPHRAIYRNTTIDPPGTKRHALEMGAEVVNPSETFYEIVARLGMPNRHRRFCCAILKEYPILPRIITGVRRSESVKRAARYKEPEVCRKYPGKGRARMYLPLLEWTDEDVYEFVTMRGLRLAPLYYTEDGRIDVTRRLGCIGCPLASRRIRIEQYRKHPLILKGCVKAEGEYLSHTDNKAKHICGGSPWTFFYATLFYEGGLRDYYEDTKGRLFGWDRTPEEFMRDYFGI